MTQKFYAIVKDGKISEHRHLYTDKDAAETELEGMQQAHNTPWAARLKGATVAEVRVEIISKLVDTQAEYKM
jgi:hypothetical protein